MLQTHSNSLLHQDNVILPHPRSEVCPEILERVKRVGVQPLFLPEDGPQRYRQLRQERLGSEEFKHQLFVLVARCKKPAGGLYLSSDELESFWRPRSCWFGDHAEKQEPCFT